MAMHFLFMFRDKSYREFTCTKLSIRGKWQTSLFHDTTLTTSRDEAAIRPLLIYASFYSRPACSRNVARFPHLAQ
jgi:hypothetical protein